MDLARRLAQVDANVLVATPAHAGGTEASNLDGVVLGVALELGADAALGGAQGLGEAALQLASPARISSCSE